MLVQLDVNVLIGLLRGVPELVAYAEANQPDGLWYNQASAAEFLIRGTAADLQALEGRFGLRLIQDVSPAEIDAAARLLQSAFQGDSLGRTLHAADARVLATAYLKKQALATADLALYNRGRDLGLAVDYVGPDPALRRARAYVPRPVMVPSP